MRSCALLSLACAAMAADGVGNCLMAQDSNPELHQFFDQEWQRILLEKPVDASRLGIDRYGDRWPDLSLAAINISAQKDRAVLKFAMSFDGEQLSAADKLNLKLFIHQYESTVRLQRHRLHLIPLDQRGGIQAASSVADSIPFDSVEDYEKWIRRLYAFPAYMGQTMALMTQGIREGMLHPKVVMKRVPAQIRRQIVTRSEESLYYEPFIDMPSTVSSVEQQRLKMAARDAVATCIVPSYRTFLKFFETKYLPACFDDAGCWQRPHGQEMYADLAQHFTTTSLTPAEIHQIGLTEITRIRQLMESIQQQVGFAGSFHDFLLHLRTDPQFYFENPNDLLAAYRECCERIDPQLPQLFLALPKTGYEIAPIPSQTAPDTTTAFYEPPSADGRRPGAYRVNLYRPDMRPKFEIEALSLHEAVPGHHLQIALAMELDGQPQFRRHGRCTAFVEGWGLYSEKLGEELGMYQDPYSRFGQLTYEMWRAVRLVVDTGMHNMKWTRQQAVDVFIANTAKSQLDIANEVDRYIAWPGQALAYKIGELRIRELRTRAEQKLGQQFDVREFHHVVLRNGAVPLDVLEAQVNEWLDSPR